MKNLFVLPCTTLMFAGFIACSDTQIDSVVNEVVEDISSCSEAKSSEDSADKNSDTLYLKSSSSNAEENSSSSSSEEASIESSSSIAEESSSSSEEASIESSSSFAEESSSSSEDASIKSSSSIAEENSSSSEDASIESSSSFAEESSSSSETNPESSSSAQFTVDCSGKSYAAGNHNISITVDGKERSFIMHVPQAYKGDKPVSLLVEYHPVGLSSQNQVNSSKYKTYVDAIGGISLYPQGATNTLGPSWNVVSNNSGVDDLKFTREMITKVEELTCIDNKRVYAAGFSMGGGMAQHAACFMSDIFTAVAPAAMDLNSDNSALCAPERPVPIIMFRGTDDKICPYEGGKGSVDDMEFLGAQNNFEFWANKNGCTGTPVTNKNGCQEYQTCDEGSRVVLCTKEGGVHDEGDASIGWPFLNSFKMQY